MKILYCAKHNSGGNDDEGAIAHALKSLGHSVTCVQERKFSPSSHNTSRYDLFLFHKWYDPQALTRIKCRKVFWFFDLVQNYDACKDFRRICDNRVLWMREVIPVVDLGFCTDGDFVSAWNEDTWEKSQVDGKLAWLMQGMDERQMPPDPVSLSKINPILFLGNTHIGGNNRREFFAELKAWYRHDLSWVPAGVHGGNLCNLIGRHHMVVAPTTYRKVRYWSNRVYLVLGMGGFLLHQYNEAIAAHYQGGRHLVYYLDTLDLKHKIEEWRDADAERWKIQKAGLQHTRDHHTYRHRCQELIRVVNERLP